MLKIARIACASTSPIESAIRAAGSVTPGGISRTHWASVAEGVCDTLSTVHLSPAERVVWSLLAVGPVGCWGWLGAVLVATGVAAPVAPERHPDIVDALDERVRDVSRPPAAVTGCAAAEPLGVSGHDNQRVATPQATALPGSLSLSFGLVASPVNRRFERTPGGTPVTVGVHPAADSEPDSVGARHRQGRVPARSRARIRPSTRATPAPQLVVVATYRVVRRSSIPQYKRPAANIEYDNDLPDLGWRVGDRDPIMVTVTSSPNRQQAPSYGDHNPTDNKNK